MATLSNTNLVITTTGIETNDEHNGTRIFKVFDTIGTSGNRKFEATSDAIKKSIVST